jgi:hypothetical protein
MPVSRSVADLHVDVKPVFREGELLTAENLEEKIRQIVRDELQHGVDVRLDGGPPVFIGRGRCDSRHELPC